MGTLIEWLIFFAIIGIILTAVFAQVWEDAKEIGAEQQKRKDFREVNHWKQKAQHPMLHIKEIDGDVRNSKRKTVNMTVNEFVLRKR
jgi:hypothetical protein